MPRSTELLRDIHEINLMYLLLLQRLARSDDATAEAGLEMSAQARQWLAALPPNDLVKLARSSLLLAQLDLPPHLLLSALSQGIDAALTTRARTELQAPAPMP